MARLWLGALGALMVLALLPLPAGGQAATPPVAGAVLLEDPTGDVTFTVQDTPAPVAGTTMYPGADLVSLVMAEERSAILVTLGVAKLPSEQDPGVDGTVYRVMFSHNGREFLVRFVFTLPALGPEPFGQVMFRDSPAADYDTIWGSQVLLDRTANTMTMEVPRDLLADADGAAPYPGRLLEGIRVESGANFGGGNIQIFVPVGQSYEVQDAMPDDPAAAPSLPITLGVQQTGNARLSSATPFRASNGEATTFIYNVSVVNLSPDNDSFELSATGLPAGYTLVLPVPFVFVEGEGSAEVPVLFTMPFGHQHGALSSFVLEARSLSDAESVGRIEMGVRFLAVPQPAGHHETVYLHSAAQDGGIGPVFGFQPGYMNTVEDDPNDQDANLYNRGLSSNGPGQWAADFSFPLSPGLEMGLDVDPAKVGTVRVPIGTTLPMLQASVEATLYVVTPSGDDEEFFFFGEGTVLARMAPTAPVDITGGSVLIEGPLVPEGAGVRIPYQLGNQLFLRVSVQWTGPATFSLANEGPYVAPGGSAVLPLREWHDAVDAVLSTVGGPTLTALGKQERFVNPGEAVVFPFSVSNPLDDDVELVFEVSGSNKEWATLPSESLVAPAGETVTASVVVRAPPGSVDRERADLVLQAYSEEQPEARGLLRLVAEVDTDEDRQDDTAIAEDLEKKDTPAPGAELLILGLAAAALAMRRRRGSHQST